MKNITTFFNNLFRCNKSKTENVDIGFHPEILFLINHPYAEYVEFKEVK